jgi:hypothetical protein
MLWHDAATKGTQRVEERRLHGVFGLVGLAQLEKAEAEDALRVALIQTLQGVGLASGAATLNLRRTTDG